MKLSVSEEVGDLFPNLRVAGACFTDIDNHGTSPDLSYEKAAAVRRLAIEMRNETLGARHEVVAWRNAYAAFGVKPKRYRPTAEAFLRRLVRGGAFPTISKAVDSYLLVETEFLLPIGGYDVDHVDGAIVLARSAGGESFIAIGREGTPELTEEGEVVYRDDTKILTRRWNYIDCHEARITEHTTRLVLFTEAPDDTVSTEDLMSSVERLTSLVTRHCGGAASIFCLDISDCTREIEVVQM